MESPNRKELPRPVHNSGAFSRVRKWLSAMNSSFWIALITSILGPLLAFFMKWYVDKKVADVQTEIREKEDQKLGEQNDQTQSHQAGAINDSIETQRRAQEEWKKTHSS